MYQVRVRVKELSEAQEWSLHELSRRSGVTYATVLRYSKQLMPKVDMDAVCRLKDTFGCTWDELFEVHGDGKF